MLGDGTRRHATLVAIYTRGLGFGDALVAPELAAGHLGNPLLQTILVRTSNAGDGRSAAAQTRRALPGAARW